MRKLIEIIFNPVPTDKVRILRAVCSLAQQEGIKLDALDTEGGIVDVDRYIAKAEQEGDWRYGFENDEIQVIHGETGVLGFYHLLIREKRLGSIKGGEVWAANFSDFPGFLGSRIADYDYEFWQNADSIFEYESRGRIIDPTKLISNNLPYPLEGKVVDVSINPGRRVFKKNYIEAIGYGMWLSDQFFQLIGGYSPARLRAAGWRVEEREDCIKYLSVDPLDLSESGSVDKQKRLRAALFE